jgi:outer membrane receptor protein involved in Fe transport
VVANVPAGTYTLKVELSGFAPQTSNVAVNVGSAVALDNKLRLAGTAETVSVTAETPVINISNAEIVTTITQAQIKELPTITRDPYDLVAISGNVNDQDPTIFSGDTPRGVKGFSINGLRSTSTNALLDGAANNDEFTGSVGESIPLDAVQEFSVVSSNFSAQYGRATSGIVNVVTKSGSNDFHGTAYEFFRNEKMATRTVDQIARGIDKSPFNRNQPGFAVGGPIKRNKAQFFVSGEYTRVRSVATDISWVPTAAFLAQTSPATQAYFAKYPLVTAINGPVITRDQITSNAGGPFAALAAGTPIFGQVQRGLPVDAGGGTPQNTQTWVGRVDWSMGANMSSYVRYALENSDFLLGSNGNSPFRGFDTGQSDNNHNILYSLTRVWSLRLTSQSKVVFNRLKNLQPLGEQPDTPGLYIKSTTTNLLNTRIALPGYLPFAPGSAIPFGGPQNLFQVYQDQTWLKGRHDLRFGGSFVRIMDNRTFGAYENAVQYLGSNLANALDNMVRGQILQFSGAVDPKGKFPGQAIALPATSPSFTRNNRYNEYAVYFNDSWAAARNLTISLGARYEYYGVQHNSDPSLDSNFYYGPGASLPEQIKNGSVQIAGDSPVGGLWAPDKNNIAPRLGFAWDVRGDGRTSVRGGYGMAYERNFGNVTFNVIQNPPNYAVVDLVAGTDVPVLPIFIDNNGPLAGTGTKVLPATSLRHVDQNVVNASAHFWSASYQQQVVGNSAVGIEYTGSKGVDLYTINRENGPGSGRALLGLTTSRENTQYGTINGRANGGKSLYNGVTFSLENRGLGNTGLAFTSKYTLSRAKDNLSSTFSESNNNGNLGLLDPYNPDLDYGAADFDVRHRLSLSGIWAIPGPKSGVLQQIAGGWQAIATFTAQSGAPFTIYDCTNSTTSCPRLLVVGSVPSPSSDPAATGDPNTYAFLDLTSQLPGAGSYINTAAGNSDFGPFPSNMMERNLFRKPGKWNSDAVFAKRFRFGGEKAVQLRFELYNLFNHANLYADGSQNDISSFSRVTAFRGDTGSGDGVPAGDGQRRFQFGLKFEF